ncbi:alpha/beta fold hydrolase [Nocardioides euryhalodurans]|uniref:Alpha/beta hydrolase n=1 Tax=Nocardioides euryhalodurans TaxID=2518370 RepID=A0A4P7GHE1_9ACTN|nr:alpha/beta hydrolase [Nocardioides euryhalodurans]QBR91087.1 alpha/beta hydrolase [Nocardioides euryhalodurans]
MATLRTGGLELFHEVRGTGDPILGIHGSPSSCAFWEDAAEALAALGTCVVYDRRGFGRSAWATPPLTVDLDDHLDDAVALLAEVGGPAVVIGRSTGGLIALALAVKHPRLVRALVLLEPAVFAIHAEAQAWATQLRENVLSRAGDEPGSAARTVLELALGPGTWESFPGEVQELFAAGGPGVLAEIRGRGLDLSEQPWLPSAEELASVSQPTLVLSGESSYPAALAVDEQLVSSLPEARHEQVRGGHLIDPAHPAVLRFVTEVIADQPSD